MATKIKHLKDEEGKFYPYTHIDAVVGDDGTKVLEKVTQLDHKVGDLSGLDAAVSAPTIVEAVNKAAQQGGGSTEEIEAAINNANASANEARSAKGDVLNTLGTIAQSSASIPEAVSAQVAKNTTLINEVVSNTSEIKPVFSDGYWSGGKTRTQSTGWYSTQLIPAKNGDVVTVKNWKFGGYGAHLYDENLNGVGSRINNSDFTGTTDKSYTINNASAAYIGINFNGAIEENEAVFVSGSVYNFNNALIADFVNSKVGDLTKLGTSAKGSAVEAINETLSTSSISLYKKLTDDCNVLCIPSITSKNLGSEIVDFSSYVENGILNPNGNKVDIDVVSTKNDFSLSIILDKWTADVPLICGAEANQFILIRPTQINICGRTYDYTPTNGKHLIQITNAYNDVYALYIDGVKIASANIPLDGFAEWKYLFGYNYPQKTMNCNVYYMRFANNSSLGPAEETRMLKSLGIVGNISENGYIPSEEITAFIIAGQSNADGRGEYNELDLGYKKSYKTTSLWLSDGVEKPVHFPMAPNDKVGAEFAIATELEAYGEKAVVIKCAAGGTPIEPNGSYYCWKIGETNSLYNHLKLMIKYVKSTYKNYHIKWRMLWLQGETDAENSTAANKYVQNFEAILSAIESDTDASIKVAIGKLKPSTYGQYINVVNDAYNTIASNHSNVMLLDTTSLTLSDAYHYNTESICKLGKMAFNAIR